MYSVGALLARRRKRSHDFYRPAKRRKHALDAQLRVGLLMIDNTSIPGRFCVEANGFLYLTATPQISLIIRRSAWSSSVNGVFCRLLPSLPMP